MSRKYRIGLPTAGAAHGNWYVDFTYDPARGGGKISLQITDLPAPGDHLRAMALVHDSHLAAESFVRKARNALMHAAKLSKELTPKLMEIGTFHRKPLTLETIFGGR